MSIAEEPHVLASSLPARQLKRAAPGVIEWVKLNKGALPWFWDEGETFSIHVKFVGSLQRLKEQA